MLQAPDINLKEGETVFSVICLDGNSISFSGYRVSTSYNRIQDEYINTIEGEGAIFSQNSIAGVLADSSEVVISLDSVSVVEVDRYNTLKMILIPVGVIVSGLIIYGVIWRSSGGEL